MTDEASTTSPPVSFVSQREQARDSARALGIFVVAAGLAAAIDATSWFLLVVPPPGGIGLALARFIDLVSGIASLAFGITFVLAVIPVGKFLVQANRNAASIYRPMRFSPGSMVWWYFAPVLQLVRPYQSMRELWDVSIPYSRRATFEPPATLPLWWALWLIGLLLIRAGGNMSFGTGAARDAIMGSAVDIVGCSCLIGAAVLLGTYVVQLAVLQDEAYAERIGATLPD